MRKPPTPGENARAVARFNARHKVGDTITVAPGAHDGRRVDVQVAEPGAYIMGGHTAVVQVTGGHGCIALNHVVPR